MFSLQKWLSSFNCKTRNFLLWTDTNSFKNYPKAIRKITITGKLTEFNITNQINHSPYNETNICSFKEHIFPIIINASSLYKLDTIFALRSALSFLPSQLNSCVYHQFLKKPLAYAISNTLFKSF